MEGETLGDVKAEALVDELPNSLAHVNDETIPHTMRHVEGEAVVRVFYDTLAGVEGRTTVRSLGD